MGCGLPSNPQPTQAGFNTWVYTATGIPTSALPTDSVWLTYAYDVAIAIVNEQLNQTPGPIYMLAVYNLAAHNLICFAQDVMGQFYPSPPAPPASTVTAPTVNTGYFAYLRYAWDINGFIPGVIHASADVSTSQSMVPLEQYKNWTIANLQQAKTPYGRNYLGFAASVGTLWGIS